MAVVASTLGMDSRNAFRIWKRDRLNHASPNSAQTESACAGALHLRLAGDAVYSGKVVKKPYIGDDDRSIEAKDIVRANRLMYMTSVLMLILCCGARAAVLFILAGGIG
jgi:adenosylcobinamide-phosphate synthase